MEDNECDVSPLCPTNHTTPRSPTAMSCAESAGNLGASTAFSFSVLSATFSSISLALTVFVFSTSIAGGRCSDCLRKKREENKNSHTGNRTRIGRVRACYPNQLDYMGPVFRSKLPLSCPTPIPPSLLHNNLSKCLLISICFVSLVEEILISSVSPRKTVLRVWSLLTR